MRQKLQLLLEAIDGEMAKAKHRAEQTRKAANEIARSAAASPSQSGDREHSAGQALITQNVLVGLQTTQEDIQKALMVDVSLVQAPCFLELELGGKRLEFYFIDNPPHITGLSFISVKSALGKVILNKKIGETFEFDKKKGKIVTLD